MSESRQINSFCSLEAGKWAHSIPRTRDSFVCPAFLAGEGVDYVLTAGMLFTCPKEHAVFDQIEMSEHLHDYHGWDFERIADWLDLQPPVTL